MPPRRRAFRSNDFGLEPTTIPRDAKRQAKPPSRQGTHSCQNHFRCNPSRRLVEPRLRFAASNAHPRLNVLPRRDFPAHRPVSTKFSPLPGLCDILQTVSLSHREGALLRGKRSPRCDCRQRAVLPHTALLRRLYGVNKILSLRDCSRKSIVYYFYRALAPDGTAQGKLLIIGINFLIS